jgi:hypothetical protein
LTAKLESDAEKDWDRELGTTGLAERLGGARELAEQNGGPSERDWSPIYIPPGKENTVRGRLVARINAARARMARYEAETNAER